MGSGDARDQTGEWMRVAQKHNVASLQSTCTSTYLTKYDRRMDSICGGMSAEGFGSRPFNVSGIGSDHPRLSQRRVGLGPCGESDRRSFNY